MSVRLCQPVIWPHWMTFQNGWNAWCNQCPKKRLTETIPAPWAAAFPSSLNLMLFSACRPSMVTLNKNWVTQLINLYQQGSAWSVTHLNGHANTEPIIYCPSKTNKSLHRSLHFIKCWWFNQLRLHDRKVVNEGKRSECALTNQGRVKLPDLTGVLISKWNQTELLFEDQKPERVQWCHRINNLLVNQTATSPEPPSASPSEHIQLQLGSYWGGGTVSQWRICSIISLFSQISALPQLPHYHTHKLRAKSIISYSFSPSAELI